MVTVNEERCVGCGLCVPFCPAEALQAHWVIAVIIQESCTECLACIEYCPNEALEVEG